MHGQRPLPVTVLWQPWLVFFLRSLVNQVHRLEKKGDLFVDKQIFELRFSHDLFRFQPDKFKQIGIADIS